MEPEDLDIPQESQYTPRRFSLPPKPRSSPFGLTIGIMIILALLVGGGIAIHSMMQSHGVLPAPPAPIVPAEKPPTLPSAPAVRPSPIVIPSPPTEPQPAVVPAKEHTTAEWDRLQETYRTAPAELAIVALQDFLQTSPNSTLAPTAQAQIEESLDRLWWLRLKGLCDKREDLNRQIGDIDKQIEAVRAHGAVEERINELQAFRGPLTKELELVQQHLDEMKYTDTRTPDPYDPAQLAELRKSRDMKTWTDWKTKLSTSLRRTRGKLPW